MGEHAQLGRLAATTLSTTENKSSLFAAQALKLRNFWCPQTHHRTVETIQRSDLCSVLGDLRLEYTAQLIPRI